MGLSGVSTSAPLVDRCFPAGGEERGAPDDLDVLVAEPERGQAPPRDLATDTERGRPVQHGGDEGGGVLAHVGSKLDRARHGLGTDPHHDDRDRELADERRQPP
jgi:hypothetical protein